MAALRMGVCLAAVARSWTATAADPLSQAELLADVAAIQPGQSFLLGFRITLADGWHTYWTNPGDTGLAPEATWQLPEGITAEPLRFPAPERFEEHGMVSYGYAREVLLLQPMRAADTLPAGGTVKLRVRFEWLICERACLQRSADLEISLPVQAEAPTGTPVTRPRFDRARGQLPVTDPQWQWRATADRKAVTLCATPPTGLAPALLRQARFFPLQRELVSYAEAAWRPGRKDACSKMERFTPSARLPARLQGVLVLPAGPDETPRALNVDVPLTGAK